MRFSSAHAIPRNGQNLKSGSNISLTESKGVKPEREGEKGEGEKEKGGKGIVQGVSLWSLDSLISNDPIITYGREASYYRYEN